MKIARLSDVTGIINKIAPPALMESWDNSGLQVGNPSAEIQRIMVALDATATVVEHALDTGCQLLVTHHPLIFKPIKSVSTSTAPGNLIHAAIRGNLAIVSMHTNYDIADKGLNDVLATRLNLCDCVPLQITSRQELAKLVVYLPLDHLEQIRNVLIPYAQSLGAYNDCSFTTDGEGTFTPRDGATPFIGSVNTFEQVQEHRLEILIDRTKLSRAISTLLTVHPYDEPAFDIYPLLNEGSKLGLGRIGRLPQAVPLAEFAGQVGSLLHAQGLRYVGSSDTLVSRVALCSGSGSSLLNAAKRAGANVLVTGDTKYHDARDAQELGIALIDAGHFPTEVIMIADVCSRLQEMLRETGYCDCQVLECPVETDPFRFHMVNPDLT